MTLETCENFRCWGKNHKNDAENFIIHDVCIYSNNSFEECIWWIMKRQIAIFIKLSPTYLHIYIDVLAFSHENLEIQSMNCWLNQNLWQMWIVSIYPKLTFYDLKTSDCFVHWRLVIKLAYEYFHEYLCPSNQEKSYKEIFLKAPRRAFFHWKLFRRWVIWSYF